MKQGKGTPECAESRRPAQNKRAMLENGTRLTTLEMMIHTGKVIERPNGPVPRNPQSSPGSFFALAAFSAVGFRFRVNLPWSAADVRIRNLRSLRMSQSAQARLRTLALGRDASVLRSSVGLYQFPQSKDVDG
jgi:hypothetical protein